MLGPSRLGPSRFGVFLSGLFRVNVNLKLFLVWLSGFDPFLCGLFWLHH